MYILPKWKTYHALHGTDKQTVKNLTGLVRVTDILESLSAVLATDIKKDLLTTTVYYELAASFTGVLKRLGAGGKIKNLHCSGKLAHFAIGAICPRAEDGSWRKRPQRQHR